MATDGMQWDVLEALRFFRERRTVDNPETWKALEEFAPVVTCWAYGHPSQPKPRAKWKDRPWRCPQCQTWWVTERYTNNANYDVGGSWRWIRIENHPQEVSDE